MFSGFYLEVCLYIWFVNTDIPSCNKHDLFINTCQTPAAWFYQLHLAKRPVIIGANLLNLVISVATRWGFQDDS